MDKNLEFDLEFENSGIDDSEFDLEFGSNEQPMDAGFAGYGSVVNIVGKTPLLRINSDDYWEVSYDEGESWESIGVKASVVHTWNGTVLTITSQNGTSSADLKGDSPYIKDGYWWVGNTNTNQKAIPQKGVEYWTEADKEEMKTYVKGAIPTNVSAFENDAGYAKTSEVSTAISVHTTSPDSHSDIRTNLEELRTLLTNFLDSDDTTLDQLSELISAIKANKDTIEAITTSKVNVTDIFDNLTTSLADKPLSANQGVVLKELIDKKADIGVFVGTEAEYNTAYSAGEVAVGTIVVMIDSGTTAILGKAILGKMILGTK